MSCLLTRPIVVSNPETWRDRHKGTSGGRTRKQWKAKICNATTSNYTCFLVDYTGWLFREGEAKILLS